MNDRTRMILIAVLLIMMQGIIDNYVHLTVYLDLTLLPFIIIIMPHKMSSLTLMTIAFLTGLAADIFGNGILGMNAAALTAIAACRNVFSKFILGPEIIEKEERPDPDFLPPGKFLTFSILLVAIHLFIFILIDSAGFHPMRLNILRFILSLIADTALMTLLFYLTGRRRK